MATPFNLPALGENVDAGTVVGILVAVGDQVEENQPVLEIETDKANLEVPSGFSGVVTEILVENGATAEVGAPVLMYEEGAGEGAAAGGDAAPEAGVAAAVRETAAAAASEAAAAEADGQAEAEAPAAGAPDAETRETNPQAPQTPPPEPSVSQEPSAPPAADAGPAEITAAPPPPSPPAPIVPAATSTSGAPVPAAPSVRRFAREIGLDIGQVPGTGPDGRISVEDVKSHSRQLSAGQGAAGPRPSAPASLPDFAKWGPVETEPMSNLRRAAAEHLSAAWSNIPHVTYADKADVTDMEALRKQFGP
ncbi:MAG: E3 binding domain-containing protein, partial [Gemmatimonadota bacterium]|nr:E3 binding domain-containing protein [Gemmatimonadota bacterium]